jgi:hypothetical protein
MVAAQIFWGFAKRGLIDDEEYNDCTGVRDPGLVGWRAEVLWTGIP